MKSKKALVISYGFSGNLGDRAIFQGMQVLFDKKNIKLHQFYDVFDVAQLVQEKSFCSIEQSIIKKFIKKILFIDFLRFFKTHYYFRFRCYKNFKKIIMKYDYLIIGGGNLLMSSSDITNPVDQFYYTKQADKSGKEIYYFSVGVGPIKSWFARKMFKASLNRASGISVRDKYSMKVLKKDLNIKKKIKLLYDPAFHLPITLVNRKKLIGVSTLAYMHPIYYPNGKKDCYLEYLDKMKKLIDGILQNNKGYRIVLLTTDYPMDYACAYDLYKMINDKRVIKPKVYPNVNSLCKALAQCKYVVSTRMHSAILSIVNRVPVYIISWQQKTTELSKLFDLENVTIDISQQFFCFKEGQHKMNIKKIDILKKHNNEIIKTMF